jgi:hypothetical protein
MENQVVVEHAERILVAALTRWKFHGTGAAGEGFTSILIDDLFRRLLRFNIESVVRVPPEYVRVPADEVAKLQSIKHSFEARVTIDVCDCPANEVRPLGIEWHPVGRQTFHRLYYVRQYVDDGWLVMLASEK